MEIKITTEQLLKVLQILSWIIFIGLCIEAGGILFNALYTTLINPVGAKSFYQNLDLSSLYNFDKGYFVTEILLMSIVSILKSILFYLIVKIFHNKKLSLKQPFNTEMKEFISNLSYLSLAIGFFCCWGNQYTNWLIAKGVAMPNITNLKFDAADVWLFMGIILLVIAQIFKRGVAIQSENDLTI
jgi:hypothetical protein